MARLVMKEGEALDKDKLTKALTANRLALTSMEEETITPPEAAYKLTVTGGT